MGTPVHQALACAGRHASLCVVGMVVTSLSWRRRWGRGVGWFAQRGPAGVRTGAWCPGQNLTARRGPTQSAAHVWGSLGTEALVWNGSPAGCAGLWGTLGPPVVGEGGARRGACGSPIICGLQVGDAGLLEAGLWWGLWATGPGRAFGAMGPGAADHALGRHDACHGPVPA